jgi:hypothetical protein
MILRSTAPVCAEENRSVENHRISDSQTTVGIQARTFLWSETSGSAVGLFNWRAYSIR